MKHGFLMLLTQRRAQENHFAAVSLNPDRVGFHPVPTPGWFYGKTTRVVEPASPPNVSVDGVVQKDDETLAREWAVENAQNMANAYLQGVHGAELPALISSVELTSPSQRHAIVRLNATCLADLPDTIASARSWAFATRRLRQRLAAAAKERFPVPPNVLLTPDQLLAAAAAIPLFPGLCIPMHIEVDNRIVPAAIQLREMIAVGCYRTTMFLIDDITVAPQAILHRQACWLEEEGRRDVVATLGCVLDPEGGEGSRI